MYKNFPSKVRGKVFAFQGGSNFEKRVSYISNVTEAHKAFVQKDVKYIMIHMPYRDITETSVPGTHGLFCSNRLRSFLQKDELSLSNVFHAIGSC